jgi:hypothetical protein
MMIMIKYIGKTIQTNGFGFSSGKEKIKYLLESSIGLKKS